MNEAIAAALREERKRNYPGYYDYRSPRTAQEYLHNNVRRRLYEQSKRVATIRYWAIRICAVIGLAFVMALLVGCA